MAGESIRSIVQRCYSNAQIHLTQSELDQTSVQPAATSGPLSPATPAGQTTITPPTPQEVIAELVGRCYSPNAIPNSPNLLDQENPRPTVPPAALTPDPMPGDVIRNLVDRCYPEGILPNNPNDLDKDNPLPTFDPPALTPDPTPNQIIQGLVNRCYPDIDLTPPPLPEIEDDDFPGFEIDIGDIITWINEIIPIPYDFTGPIVVVPPDGPKGKTFPSIGKDGDQCLELARLDAKGLLKKIAKDTYKHKETGEIYKCDGYDEPTGTPWGKCVREALECMMRPYIGGQWRPPAPSCDSYYPSGWSSNKNEICIKNCYPDRLAVYEHGLTNPGPPVINVRFAHRNKNGMWAGTVQTTDTDGNNVKGYVFNEGGNQIFNNNYSGTFTTGSGGINVTVSVNAIADGGDYDSEWRIDSWSGYANPGTEWTYNFNVGNNTAYLDFEVFGDVAGDTIYTTDPVPPNGYEVLNNGKPVFHVLKEPIPEKTVPIFNYYSSSKVDSMLSTNPGMPDSSGNGERDYINQHGYLFQYVLGHAFIKQDGAIGYKRKKDDPTQALVRLFDAPPWDHQATIDAEIPLDHPKRMSDRNSYRIPMHPRQDLRVTVDCEHGSAGYENSLGFYLANDDGPQKGYIVVPNAKDTESQQSIIVPLKRLKEYQGGTMGFFIVPDGNDSNNYDRGDDVDFSPHSSGGHGDGFRANGISSAENNYCLFSDAKWNPEDGKDYTQWKGSGKQFWEDLIDGDDDYDDMKLYHIIEWRTENNNYDGVLGYVYQNAAPPKIMRPLNPQVECDTRLLKSGFKDIVLQRQDCGSQVAGTEQYTIDYECGKCTGGYSNRMNQSQTIEIVTGGTFIFTSGGGITQGVLGECTKFRIRVLKNGNEVYNKRWTAKRWPPIGQAITNEIPVSAGDTLTFEVPEIISGGPNASVAPALHLYNSESAAYESSFNIQLITINGDNQIAESTGAPATNDQLGTTINYGGVNGIAMQFAPVNSRRNWQAGSHKNAPYHINPGDSPNGTAATQVWENGSAVVMQNPANNNVPDHPGYQSQPNDVRGSGNNNSYFPNSDAYIDTGFLRKGVSGYNPRGPNQYSGADEELLETFTGNYNHMLEEYLVTRMDFYDGVPSLLSDSKVDTLKKKMPHTAVRGGTPWYIAAGDSGRGIDVTWYGVIDDVWHGNPLRGPVTFVHDYKLDNLKGKHANMIVDPAKVRIGITFYSIASTSNTRSPSSSADYYWQAIIEVIDVLNPGVGYQQGMEFDFHWPPIRDDRTEQPGTPFYPDKIDPNWKYPKQNLKAYYEGSNNVDRYAKEAIYQESHRTDSPIWYLATDDKKKRVKFKLIITGTTDD